MNEPAEPRPRRRRLAVSVRVFLALVAVSAVPMAWFNTRVLAQRRAVALVKQVRGYVYMDHQRVSPGVYNPSTDVRAKVRPWLLKILPVEFFQEVGLVGLRGTGVDDDDLEVVAGLAHAEHLDLTDCRVTDAGLRYLRRMPRLKTLMLRRTGVTDAGLGELAGLRDLRALYLGGTNVSDAGVASLLAIPRLNFVTVGRTGISPEGVDRLRKARPNLVVNTDLVQ